MAKQATGRDTRPGGSARKAAARLEKARAAQHQAELKVGKLRARLEAAEAKLSKRSRRVELLQARVQHDEPAAASRNATGRREKGRTTVQDRLAAIGMRDSAVEPREAAATPVSAPDGTQDSARDDLAPAPTVDAEEVHAPDGDQPRTQAQRRNSHGDRAGAKRDLPPA